MEAKSEEHICYYYCLQLLRSGKASWQGMVCEDEDDFQVLLRNGAGEAMFHFSVGDTVLLMHAEAHGPPSEDKCFSRLAQVRRVELASFLFCESLCA